MLTLEEKTALANLNRFREDIKKSIQVLCKLEAMKAANKECERFGKELKYKEDDFNSLLD